MEQLLLRILKLTLVFNLISLTNCVLISLDVILFCILHLYQLIDVPNTKHLQIRARMR